MWALFFGTVIVVVLVLYVPGAIAVRGFGASWLVALCTAPAMSIAGYCLFGIVYGWLGVASSWRTVLLPWLFVCLAIFCVGYFRRIRNNKSCIRSYLSVDAGISTALLYAAVGLAVGLAIFVCALGTPYSFLQEYDNSFHLNVLRSFAESGSWSCLDVSKYLTEADSPISPLPAGGFYPAGWHVVGALVISLTSLSPALIENALNFTFSSLAFPLSMCVLMASLFRSYPRVVKFGSIAAMAFVVFPWGLIVWGPLFPNLAAYAVLPGVAALLVLCWDQLCSLRRGAGEPIPWVSILLVAVGAVALALLQPNALFFGLVLLTPYAAYRLAFRAAQWGSAPRRRDIAAAVILVGAAIAFWTALYFSPVMTNVFNDTWPSFASKSETVVSVLGMGLVGFPMQLCVAVTIILGIVYAVHHREYAWIVLVYALLCVMYFFDCATDGTIKQYLTGFWYSDSHRIAACIAIVGALMLAMGLEQVSVWVDAAVGKLRGRQIASAAVGTAIAVLFVVFNLTLPSPATGGQQANTAYQKIFTWLKDDNNTGNLQRMYASDEERFVDEVADVIPEGSLVVNVPDDGSAFAYGADGLRVYYRDFRTYRNIDNPSSENEPAESDESVIIRTKLDEVATNEDVQEALRAIGAQYLLVLDEGDMDGQIHLFTYDKSLWTGITAISDDTPGFEVILSEGDMRLYRIEPVATE